MKSRERAPIGLKAWVDFDKGVAILLVVAFHVYLYLNYFGVDAVLGRAKAVFELYPLPSFFFLSGLFASRIGSWTFHQLWHRRLAPLLYLYVLWSAVRLVFYFVVPGVNGELGEIPATNPLSLALILVWPNSSYWFLYALCLFTLFAWMTRNIKTIPLLIVSAIISTAFSSGLLNTGNIGWNRVTVLFIFYVVGVRYSIQLFELINRSKLVHALALAVILALAATPVLLLGLRWLPFLILIGQFTAVICGAVLSKYLVQIRWLAFVSTMGRLSLQIYLLHLFIIVGVGALLSLLTPAWPIWVDLSVQLLLTIGTIIASIQLSKVASRARWLFVPPRLQRFKVRKATAAHKAASQVESDFPDSN